MTFLNTFAIYKTFIVSVHTLATVVKSNLLEKFGIYLNTDDGILSAKALQLFRYVNAFLKRENTTVFNVFNESQNMLQKINDRLKRIKNKITMPTKTHIHSDNEIKTPRHFGGNQ